MLAELLRRGEDVVLTGGILQEILQAFRSESTFRRVAQYFEPFALLPFERADYVAAAGIHRTCKQHGVSASTMDCQIVAAAIRYDCALLSADKDFERIARHCGLLLA